DHDARDHDADDGPTGSIGPRESPTYYTRSEPPAAPVVCRAGRHASLSRFARSLMSPVDAALGAAHAALALALLFVLPGMTVGALALPGAPTPLHAIGRAIGVSLLISGGVCAALAVVGQLHSAPLAFALVAVTLAPLADPRMRSSRGRVSAIRSRRRRWWLGAAAGLFVLAVTVIVPSVTDAGP